MGFLVEPSAGGQLIQRHHRGNWERVISHQRGGLVKGGIRISFANQPVEFRMLFARIFGSSGERKSQTTTPDLPANIIPTKIA